MALQLGWRVRHFKCDHCHGANMRWSYSSDAPVECCCNDGVEFYGPNGKVFAYPGGPFLGGKATPENIAESQPYEALDA